MFLYALACLPCGGGSVLVAGCDEGENLNVDGLCELNSLFSFIAESAECAIASLPTDFRPPNSDLAKYSQLEGATPATLARNFAVLKRINESITGVLAVARPSSHATEGSLSRVGELLRSVHSGVFPTPGVHVRLCGIVKPIRIKFTQKIVYICW